MVDGLRQQQIIGGERMREERTHRKRAFARVRGGVGCRLATIHHTLSYVWPARCFNVILSVRQMGMAMRLDRRIGRSRAKQSMWRES